MPKHCVAYGCTNHNYMHEKNLSFCIFPNKLKQRERYERWVQACKRVNPDGTRWEPKSKHVYLCSEHFIEGKANSNPSHPDYVPTVFKYTDATRDKAKLNRFNSAAQRAKNREVMLAKKELANLTPAAVVRGQLNDALQAPSSDHDSLLMSPTTSIVDESASHNILLSPSSVDFSLEENKAIASTPKRFILDNNMVAESEENSNNCDPISSINLTEMNFLRAEKLNLMSKVKALEEQVMFSRYDPKYMAGNDETCHYLTGLSYDVFNFLCEFLEPHLKRPRVNLPLRNQILMVLVRLRMNLPLQFISLQVGLSRSTVHSTFHKIVDLMYTKLNVFICWQDRDCIRQTVPPVFKQHFPRLTSIIDCFEIFIDRPKNLKARAEVYSNYKKHSTVKYLISCSPLGAVNFLSSGWGGRATDVHIVRNSGFISSKFHHPGDQILADRGFTLQDDFASCCSAELIIPAFTKGKQQLLAREVENTRKIASVRIHIERIIGLMKNRYHILDGPIPVSLVNSASNEHIENAVPTIDKLVTVIAALCNLSPGIVYNEKSY